MSSSAETTGLRLAVGAVRRVDERILRFAAQVGVRGVVVNTPLDLPGEERWELADLEALRERVEAHGLCVEALENMPTSFYRDVILGGPRREEQLAHALATIENIGRAGIPIFGFHWMANEVWRSELAAPGRGGARVTVFDAEALPDRDAPTFDRVYEEEEIWKSFASFLRAALPVAEAAGVRLALHPDDPPVPSIGGVGRPFRSFEGLRRAVELAASPWFGVEFCLGTMSSAMGGDAVGALRWFAERGHLAYVHFRDVRGTVPSFAECFLGEGNVDVVAAMRVLRDSGFDGCVIDDHVPLLDDDPEITPGWIRSEYAYHGRAYEIGFLEGLLAAVGER
jgi:mannonate dehydratase